MNSKTLHVLVLTGLVLATTCTALAGDAPDDAWFRNRAFTGHSLTLLPDGQHLTEARHELIASAKKSIYLSAFAFGWDEAARDIADRLCVQARRGLDVRVLVDHWGSGGLLRHADTLRKCGARVLSHDPLNWGATWVRQVLHEKLLIVDGSRVITGGSGYADYYATASHDSPKWHDLDVEITGPAACWFHFRYQNEWKDTAEQEIRPDRDLYADANGQKILERLYGLHSFVGCDTTIPPGGVRVYPLEQDPMFEGGKWLLQTHLAAISASRGRITLFSPYFVPDEALIKALLAAAKRGVAVTVLTNSSTSTDEPDAHLGLLKIAPRLLKGGVDIRLWSGKAMLHRKGGVYDGRWAFFGSDNLDRGAHDYNAEDIAFTDDPQFVSEMTAAQEEDLHDSLRLTEDEVKKELSHESFWKKLEDKVIFRYL